MEEKKPQDKSRIERKMEDQKSKWDIRPYLAIALTVILIVIVCIAIFFLVYRYHGLTKAFGKAMNILQPVIIGFIIAYLLNPIMMFFERRILKAFSKTKMDQEKQNKIARGLATAGAMVIFLVVIAVLLILMIPQLVASVQDLILTMSDKMDSLMNWVNRFGKEGGKLEEWVGNLITEVSDYLTEWLEEKVLNQEFIASITTGVYSVIKTILDAVIGLIISVYILLKKETFIGQVKKLIYTIFKPRKGNIIVEVLRKSNSIFGGFFIGKIIDSIIIGFICFGGLWILQMPYTVLVSVIVGVTNIIPVFGPYIGAIPSFILIFLVNPVQGLYFLIFIVVLQQVDGNIIGPKILGDSTGLSPFWVIFSILVFGGLFGIAGMLFGVPIFAVIYYLARRIVDHFLRKYGMPISSAEFVRIERIDPKTNEIIYKDPQKRKRYVPIKKERFWKRKKQNDAETEEEKEETKK